mgnify:CR=1 FL=1
MPRFEKLGLEDFYGGQTSEYDATFTRTSRYNPANLVTLKKAFPFYDVRAFGASDDDSTECADILNNLISNVPTGSIIYLPYVSSGIYKISDTWIINKKVKIIGFGITIKAYGDIEAILVGGTGTGAMASYIEIEGPNVTNNLTDYRNSTNSGIHVKYNGYWSFKNVRSNGFQEGVHFDAYTYSGDFIGGKLSANRYGAYFEDTSTGDDGGINDIDFWGTTFSENGTYAGGDNVRIVDGKGIRFYGGSNESAGTQGLSTITGGNFGVQDLIIDGVWFESNSTYDVKFNTLTRAFMKNTRHINWQDADTPIAVFVNTSSGELSIDGMTVRNGSATSVYTSVFSIVAGSAKVSVSNLLKDDAIKLYDTSGTHIPIVTDDSNGMKRNIGIAHIVNEDFIDDAAAWASTYEVKNRWTAASTGAGNVTIEDASSNPNGVAVLTTTTADNSYATIIYIPDVIYTDNSPIAEFRVKVSAKTSIYLFLGLASAATTNKVTANDYIGFVFDIDVDANNIYAVSNNAAAGEVATDTTIDLSGATWVVFKIDLTDVTNPKFYIFDQEVASAHTGTVQASTILYPYIHAQSLAGSAQRQGRVDYVNVWQNR